MLQEFHTSYAAALESLEHIRRFVEQSCQEMGIEGRLTYDLKLAVEMLRELKLPSGVVINRAGLNDQETHCYCRTNGIDVLAEIPDNRSIAEAYSRGEIICETLPDLRRTFQRLLDEIESRAG